MLEARSKIRLQQEKAHKELQQFVNDITTEERKIDHEKRQQNFMNTKGLERDDSERGAREREAARQLADERNQLLLDLETSWSKIGHICNDKADENTTVDTAIRKFKESEDANFALFNFVSDQNNDIEKMQEDLDNVLNDQSTYQSQLQEVEQLAEKELEEISSNKNQLIAAQEAAEIKYDDASNSLNKISEGVLSLFKKLDCTEDDLGIALKDEMLDDFIATYMAVIEARINTLLSAKIYLRSQDPENDDEFTPADAVREVLGKVEVPKIIAPPISNLFDIQYQTINNERTTTGMAMGMDTDSTLTDEQQHIIQTTDTKLGQLADAGAILSYDQLKETVKMDVSRRKTSIVLKGASRRTSMTKGDQNPESQPFMIEETINEI